MRTLYMIHNDTSFWIIPVRWNMRQKISTNMYDCPQFIVPR